jgi:hypothetical protein
MFGLNRETHTKLWYILILFYLRTIFANLFLILEQLLFQRGFTLIINSTFTTLSEDLTGFTSLMRPYEVGMGVCLTALAANEWLIISLKRMFL